MSNGGWTALTRQRRKEYGLPEISDLDSAEVEKIEAEIQELLDLLEEFTFQNLPPEMQEKWCRVDQEAQNGKDRELARAVLKNFLAKLGG